MYVEPRVLDKHGQTYEPPNFTEKLVDRSGCPASRRLMFHVPVSHSHKPCSLSSLCPLTHPRVVLSPLPQEAQVPLRSRVLREKREQIGEGRVAMSNCEWIGTRRENVPRAPRSYLELVPFMRHWTHLRLFWVLWVLVATL